jgi:PTS system galactitol-specific IIB component
MIIKILIACGSGIATSTYAEDSIKNICREIGAEVKTSKSDIASALEASASVDMVAFTSNNWKKYYDAATFPKPAISVAPLITGFAVDECKADIIKMISDIQKKNS